MKHFWRSLTYLRPHRFRLAVSVVCVIFIATLWAGGLSMLLPGAKVLLSDEGLHGWAWNEALQDRLGVRAVRRLAQAGTIVDGQNVSLVLDVITVDEDGPAAAAGLGKDVWIVGLGGEGEAGIGRADDLARSLARDEPGRVRTLLIYDPRQDRPTTQRIDVTLDPLGPKAQALVWVATELVPHEPKTKRDRFDIFFWLLIIALFVNYARDALRFVQEYLVQVAVFRGIMDLRSETYGAVLRLPVTHFSEKGVSDTMSRFVQDSSELARGQVTLFGKTLVEPAKAVASLAMAMLISWQLTLMVLIAGPPGYFLIRRFGKMMKRASRRALESWSAMLGVLEETLNGIRVVKAYTMEGSERRRFFQINRGLLKQQRRMARIDSATAPTIEAMGLTAGMVAAGVAGWWVFNDRMDADEFLAWLALLAAMFDPARKLAKVATRFQRAESAAARVFELRDTPQEKSPPGAPSLPRHARSLTFEEVFFRYPGAADDALRGVSLEIPTGQRIALVGPNGCGKTTLVSLVPRLIDPTAGRVMIDGADISRCSIRSLRRQIGLVTQDSVLFNASIYDNIAYGLRRPNHEAVLDAARKAHVHEFVESLPEGFDTVVGEHGATLSGGQKQRITIARAILRDPAILIFDEATSQVDPESEQKIHDALLDFMQDRTTLLIAHRFSTVLSADRIAVMAAGAIVDLGTHDELLRRCALYQTLYETQLGGRS